MAALLEREAELAILEDAVRGLDADRGCLVLVGGEAGIGKTSLVRELRMRIAERTSVLVGACEPLSVPVPLAPLRELAGAAGGELASGDRLHLADGLLDTMRARAPVVAVIEDAHWSDPATLEVVRLLARRVEDAPVAVVLTYRSDEVATNAALGQLLGDLATSPAVRRLALRPLSAAAVHELATPAGLDAERIARVTGGNPFLVVESIAAEGDLPETVRDATLARAARLSASGRAVVDAAAVLGHRFAPGLLERVAPDSRDAVDEALARGVIVSDGGLLGFRHELIREAVEKSMSPLGRAELHARAFEALAARRGTTDHARLAHHAEQAGLVEDACRYATLAAADAERVGALRETRLQAERALRVGAHLPDDERFELLVQHSRAANFASTRLEDAVESAEAAFDIAVSLRDRVRQGRALLALTSALWSYDDVDAAKEASEQAVAVLEPTEALAERARAQALRVRVQASASDPAVALEHAPAALELATAAALEQTALDVEISAALARGHLGDPGSLPALAEATRAARAAGFTIQTVRAYVNLVFVAATLRRHDLVDGAEHEALLVFDNAQTTIPANAVRIYCARSLLDRGRFAEAERIVTEPGRNLAAETPVVLALQGILAARRGDPEADALLERAWDEIRAVPEGSRHGTIRVALVEAAWLHGDRSSALRHLRAASTAPAAHFARPAADLAVWGARHGVPVEPPSNAPDAVIQELEGDWRRAIRSWRELDAPYESALAALPGDDHAARDALRALHALGAPATARAFARERAALGARLPRGPRPATRAHPAGLTRREQEVLDQLATGATNGTIAATLHLSERTVAHHVSAILRKLGTSTRLGAVERARARGLLAQDGQSGV